MTDLISRQAAIKAIDDLPNCYNGYSDTYDKAYIIGTLEEVPSVEPKRDIKHTESISLISAEPKHGKWLLHEYPDGYYYTECSECGKAYSEDVYFLKKPNYCPNCGSFMGEKNDKAG